MKKELRRVLPQLLSCQILWLTASASAVATAEQTRASSGREDFGAASDPAGASVLDGQYVSALLMDGDTGEVLAAKNPHVQCQPASMLKMMTELIVLERISEGDFSFDDQVTVSARASKMGGSQVYLKHGETFTVTELLKALAIHSANDAAVALAEHVAGSVEAFVDLMNLRAQEFGMRDTEFHSVHGLPPGRNQLPDLTSAFDMALLGRILMRFPLAAEWASTATAPFRNDEFTLYNPNKLVGKFRGLDGIKTGFHDQAGYCVTASAVQKGKRLISVVMGAPTDQDRATETTRLLSYGFNLYTQVTLVPQNGEPLATKLAVKGGKRGDVPLAFGQSLTVCVPKAKVQQVVLQPQLPEKVQAPLEVGQVVGKAVALLGNHVLGEVPIVTREAVPKGSWWDRLLH
jgi:D-alanyl-D-alanine carboxypeptidase (penicillin-binding protein 5/6)